MSETIFVLSNRNGTLNEHAVAMCSGLAKHGIETEIVPKGFTPPKDAKFVVCWGWREGKRLSDLGFETLVMERGYLGDRYHWTSLGWNGLNGRATWNEPADNGERFRKHFGHLVKPWKSARDGYALIMGQVRGDAALTEVIIDRWYLEAAKALSSRGFDVRFRPHPVAVERGIAGSALMDRRIGGSLDEALAGASVCVTYNSNTGVDAALAGVPVIACDEGSMAWPVAAHGLFSELRTPSRDEWFRRMAWRQWTPEEISSGLAWDHVKEHLSDKPRPHDGATGRAALVIGGGQRVFEDIDTALSLFTPDIVLAVNDIGTKYQGRIDHWCSMHPEKFGAWSEARERAGLEPVGKYWTAVHKEAPEHFKREVYPGGGSAGLAVAVARKMGAEKIVLAGVPLSEEPHFFDEVPWHAKEVNAYRRHWKMLTRYWADCVRSVSGGWTEEVYGRASRDWIEGRDHEVAA